MLQRFFFWFGGKLRSGGVYPPPRHGTIIEPFAGSAGYATRHFRRRVILVEKDPEIAGLWRYLIKVSAREILLLPDLGDRNVDDLQVSPEARTLIRYNCNRGGGGRPGNHLDDWDKAWPHSSWGPTRRAVLASQVERIRHWKIIEGDYTLAPDVVASWFVDPPYFGALGNLYRCKGKALDFAHLGTWCRSRQGQVMVCEAGEASWLPFRPLARVWAPTRHNGKIDNGGSNEVIWTNDEEKNQSLPL